MSFDTKDKKNAFLYRLFYSIRFAETFQLTGFDEIATIPIGNPIDICPMELNGTLYASTLNMETINNRNTTFFRIFKQIV